MPRLVPVDYDPFKRLTPVDHDPFVPQSNNIEDRRGPVDPLQLHMQPSPMPFTRVDQRRPMEEFNASPMAEQLGHGDINPYETMLGYGEVPEPKDTVMRRRYLNPEEQLALELKAREMQQALLDSKQ